MLHVVRKQSDYWKNSTLIQGNNVVLSTNFSSIILLPNCGELTVFLLLQPQASDENVVSTIHTLLYCLKGGY